MREDIHFDQQQPVSVARVIDGDTLALDDGVRVRLIGIDTPEIGDHPEPLALEAREFVTSSIRGKYISLRFDLERRDGYRRLLAWVSVDDELLNEQIVLAGYSRAITRFPYSHQMKRRLIAAEATARSAGRGMWSLDAHASRDRQSRDGTLTAH